MSQLISNITSYYHTGRKTTHILFLLDGCAYRCPRWDSRFMPIRIISLFSRHLRIGFGHNLAFTISKNGFRNGPIFTITDIHMLRYVWGQLNNPQIYRGRGIALCCGLRGFVATI